MQSDWQKPPKKHLDHSDSRQQHHQQIDVLMDDERGGKEKSKVNGQLRTGWAIIRGKVLQPINRKSNRSGFFGYVSLYI